MTLQINAGKKIEQVFLPDVPGLVFRHFRGEVDYPAMVQIIMESSAVDEVERAESLEDITRSYALLTNCDPYKDMIFAEVEGQVVGYGRATWWQQTNPDGWVYAHFGFLTPTWRRQGIGRAMLRFLQGRLKARAGEQIAAGERPQNARAVFQSWAADTEVGNQALLESEGFQPVRWAYTMLRPDLEHIPELPLPEGVAVRPVDWEAHKRVIFEAQAEAFRDHWGYSPPDEEDYRSWVAEIEEDPHIDPALWRVAWDGDQVVGMVRSFILPDENEKYQRLRGYTEHISVRRPWRRQGVARALIALSLLALKEHGMREAALGVDTQNTSGALRLYQYMGFEPIKKHTTYEKPMD